MPVFANLPKRRAEKAKAKQADKKAVKKDNDEKKEEVNHG